MKCTKIVEAEALCRDRPSLLAFVLLNGLTEIEGGWAAIEKALGNPYVKAGLALLTVANAVIAMRRPAARRV